MILFLGLMLLGLGIVTNRPIGAALLLAGGILIAIDAFPK